MKAPLAERLRPKQLSDYLSQTHLIGEKGTISQMIKRDLIPSIILWGPPGIGKTTLANLISKETKRSFYFICYKQWSKRRKRSHPKSEARSGII